MTASHDELIGTVIDDRYEILSRIGQGGMGQVYRALHRGLGRVVAVKLLTDVDAGPESIRRFQREARATARLAHPGVVSVLDAGSVGGRPFLVMEYVHGESLDDALARAGALNERAALKIVAQLADALDAAHAAGIVHRDVKAANVMLVRDGDRQRAVLLDFGLAWIAEDVATNGRLTRAGLVVGTPEYMAPEQVLRAPVDARTDLYSLGVLLYELLVGKTPFADEQSPLHIAFAHVQKPVPPLPVSIDPATISLVEALLAKNPGDRPATAKDVLASLARIEAATHTLALRATVELAPERPLAVIALRSDDGAIDRSLPWIADECQRAGAHIAQVVDGALLAHCAAVETAVRLSLSLGSRLSVGVHLGRAEITETGSIFGPAVAGALAIARIAPSRTALLSDAAHDALGGGLRGRLVPAGDHRSREYAGALYREETSANVDPIETLDVAEGDVLSCVCGAVIEPTVHGSRVRVRCPRCSRVNAMRVTRSGVDTKAVSVLTAPETHDEDRAVFDALASAPLRPKRSAND
ncbi:MAG: serine/threonine protein kinase [Myxococcales bacterium]|nr:serine/threonine protein kinase [Myxococcales bacterium]